MIAQYMVKVVSRTWDVGGGGIWKLEVLGISPLKYETWLQPCMVTGIKFANTNSVT